MCGAFRQHRRLFDNHIKSQGAINMSVILLKREIENAAIRFIWVIHKITNVDGKCEWS